MQSTSYEIPGWMKHSFKSKLLGKYEQLIGKGVNQGCILSPCLFTFYAEYIMRSAGLEEAQAGIKTAWRNKNILRYADDTALRQQVKSN